MAVIISRSDETWPWEEDDYIVERKKIGRLEVILNLLHHPLA
jgi:hypothetical protein